MQIFFHPYDLPQGLDLGKAVAIDTETMGLYVHRDRLCLVQLSSGDGTCHLVHIAKEQLTGGKPKPENLINILKNEDVVKIFHFARFDVAALYHAFGVLTAPIFCTKIASKLIRTFTDKHGLKELCKEFLKVDISKQEQTSDWGAEFLTDDQKKYAATDVLYLHQLKNKLEPLLLREGRQDIAAAAFKFLPHRAILDVLAGDNYDILSY